jgi:hypothetical protein
MFTNISTKSLERAIVIREKIEKLEAELAEIMSGGPVSKPAKEHGNKRRKMSDATKVKMAATARTRWRKAKAAGKTRL